VIIWRYADVTIATFSKLAVLDTDIPPIGGIMAIGTLPGMVVGGCRVTTLTIGKGVIVRGLPVRGSVAIGA
jgi:hypothetical protein